MIKGIFTRINRSLSKRPKTYIFAFILILLVLGGVSVIRRPQLTLWTSTTPTAKMTWPPNDRTMVPFYIGSADDVATDVTLHDFLLPLMLLGYTGYGLPAAIGIFILDQMGILEQFRIVDMELYIYSIPVDIEWLDGDRNIKSVKIAMGEQVFHFHFREPGMSSFKVSYDFVVGFAMSQFDVWCPDSPLECYEGKWVTIRWAVTIEDYDGNKVGPTLITRKLWFSQIKADWASRPDMDVEKWKEYGGYYRGDVMGVEDAWILLPVILMGLAFYKRRKKEEYA